MPNPDLASTPDMEFGHIAGRDGSSCIDAWGAGPFVLTARGKQYRFEDSDRFGPALVKKNGDPLTNPWPSERSPFWAAHRVWVDQGRRIEADKLTCIIDPVPEPRPTFWTRVGRNKVIVQNGDEGGDYIEVKP